MLKECLDLVVSHIQGITEEVRIRLSLECLILDANILIIQLRQRAGMDEQKET